MNNHLRAAVEHALTHQLGEPISISHVEVIHGGCINSTFKIAASSNAHFFLKSNAQAPEGMFEAETEGLEAILQTSSIRCPRPLAISDSDFSPAFLILEFIRSAPQSAKFAELLGRGLAQMHRSTADRFGFENDNYIGSSPQCNEWSAAWPEFFARARLGFQLKLLQKKGRATGELEQRLTKLIEKLPDLIGRHNPPPSLLHGDLWGGNVISDESGAPVIIDPAVYYGDREVDLAMTELFGRFDPAFYAAYREAYPLPDGYDLRRDVYNLYHLMNHLLIFGLSYMGGLMDILRRYT